MDFKKLSIVIPVYNEAHYLPKVLKLLDDLYLPLEKEIIIIDDCSSDGTREYLENLVGDYKIIFKEKNEGKGSAIRKGFDEITGDLVIIQDADLEYDINEYSALMKPILEDGADVVYGSRFISKDNFYSPYRLHTINNWLITKVSNLFTGFRLTDMETCYKVLRREVLEDIKGNLVSNRFGIEPEITHYLSLGKWRIQEVPVSYRARTFEEGKKIKMRDGVAAVWHMLRFFIGSKTKNLARKLNKNR